MSCAAAQPFSCTATGLLGEKRETMLENQLLLRCELGKPMKRGYKDYPGITFRYGKQNAIKEGGAAEALSEYPAGRQYFHNLKDSANSNPDVLPGRDFMALNKSAVLAGLTSAADQNRYRATHDIRQRVQTEGDKKKASRRIMPHVVYGTPTRPSTPIHDLLEHKYQDRWLHDRKNMEICRNQDEAKYRSPGKVHETRASMLRAHKVPVEAGPLWQLPKFTKKASPHLESFRSDNARSAALSRHATDRVSRRGLHGHGVYESAKY